MFNIYQHYSEEDWQRDFKNSQFGGCESPKLSNQELFLLDTISKTCAAINNCFYGIQSKIMEIETELFTIKNIENLKLEHVQKLNNAINQNAMLKNELGQFIMLLKMVKEQ
jgi:hypothetical protein